LPALTRPERDPTAFSGDIELPASHETDGNRNINSVATHVGPSPTADGRRAEIFATGRALALCGRYISEQEGERVI
jgi:hypothetical protein